MRTINFAVVVRFISLLLLINAGFMSICLAVSLFYQENDQLAVGLSMLSCLIFGAVGYFSFKKQEKRDLDKREGFLIVTFGWVFMVFFGALPFFFYGLLETPEENYLGIANAFFESMSGYTTTGASILSNIEAMPHGLLLWRSFTHWIGGMGIIVLTIAILPLLGVGGMQLFLAESPGISAGKLHPRITETAKRLWLVYVLLTLILGALLFGLGMTPFDAINHAFSTMSTGGFSTKNTSVAYWNDSPAVQYVICLFMFIAGISFALNYYVLKLNFSPLKSNTEFKTYVSIVALATIFVTFMLWQFAQPGNDNFTHPDWSINGNHFELETAFRHSLFQVLAVITTTGFVTSDFSTWLPLLSIFFFVLMFIGGSSGSTSGGVKVVRHFILFKNSQNEFKRQLHPNAIVPVRFNGKSVPSNVISNVLAFFMIYFLTFLLGGLAISFTDIGYLNESNVFATSLGVSASCLGNVGPAFGAYGPAANFSGMTDTAKWICTFLMLLGRLELFSVIVIFTRSFWRN